MSGERDLDELLAGWLDGALSPEDAAAFEAELARNPELAARAESWRGNDAFITGALAPLAELPLEKDMLARMGLAEQPAPPLAANDNPPWWRSRWLPAGGAIAAALALALVLTQRPAGPQDGGVSLALESTPALQPARLADGRTLVPELTARAADGRWCREYRIGDTAGLACRGKDGWKVEAEGKLAPPATTGDVQLAGGESSAAVDAANRRLGTADPLDAKAEAALLAKEWGDR